MGRSFKWGESFKSDLNFLNWILILHWTDIFNTWEKRLLFYYLKVARKAKGLKGKGIRKSKVVSYMRPTKFGIFNKPIYFH